MTNFMKPLASIVAVWWLAVLLAAPISAEEQAGAGAERFQATAFSLGGLMVGGRSAPSGTTRLEIVVERTSTDAERDKLLAAVKSGGPGELHDLLNKTDPVGRIILQGKLGYDLRYAREIAGEGGQRNLILATDRPLEFRELARGERSRKYDVSVIELVVDAAGKGSGVAMPAVQVEYDEGSGGVSLVNLNTSPVKLNNVKKTE